MKNNTPQLRDTSPTPDQLRFVPSRLGSAVLRRAATEEQYDQFRACWETNTEHLPLQASPATPSTRVHPARRPFAQRRLHDSLFCPTGVGPPTVSVPPPGDG
jgi:hypothetical protein